MVVDDRLKETWKASQDIHKPGDATSLGGGGGDGHSPKMQVEVALLKQRADQADQRMARIEDKLDRIVDKLDGFGEKLGGFSDRLAGVATKATVWTALGTGAGVAVAIVALFVGVLTYLRDQRIAARPEPTAAAAPQPVIIQLPPWPALPPTLPSPAAPG